MVAATGHGRQFVNVVEMLREKMEHGVKQVRVTTVLSALEQEQAQDRAREAAKKREATKKAQGTAQKLDLVGTAEAAAMLGVERPRIGRWRKAGIMPEPVAEIAATPVWLRSQIEGIQAEREKRRRPGHDDES
jgi:hypothetical protein